MKKALFCIVFILGILVAFNSCISTGSSSYKLTVNEDIPIEQCAIITFPRGDQAFFVKEWNGIDISDNLYGNNKPSNKDDVILTVPAGNSKFTFNVAFSTEYKIYVFNDLEIPLNLEQGKKYKFIGEKESLGFAKGYNLLLKFNDVTNGSTMLKEWNLTEMFEK